MSPLIHCPTSLVLDVVIWKRVHERTGLIIQSAHFLLWFAILKLVQGVMFKNEFSRLFLRLSK